MTKSKLSALLSLIIVFLSGGVLGAFTYRLYMVNSATAPVTNAQVRRPSPEEWRRHYLADLQKRANLDNSQVQQVNGVLDQIATETKTQMNSIHDEQIRRINDVLRPDQRALYQKMREEHEAERARRRAQQDAANKK